MPTITANTSPAVSLLVGQSLIVNRGTGMAAVLVGPARYGNVAYGLQPGRSVGPFDVPVTLSVTASDQGLDYTLSDSRSSNPPLSNDELALFRGPLSLSVSGVWNIAPSSDQAITVAPRRAVMRPRIRQASALLAAHAAAVVTAGGVAPTTAQYDAIRPHLETLMRSTAWPKLRVLWLPMGADNDINAARVCLVEASGTLALVNTGFLAGDYTTAGGLVGAAGKRLATTYSPSAAASGAYPALSSTAWGFGVFALVSNSGSTVMAGTEASNTHYLGFGGTNVSQMFGGTQVPHWSTKLLQSVQVSGANVEGWTGAYRRATAAGSGALPTGGISINAVNSGALSGSTTFGGLWVGEAMTTTDMAALRDFFADANTALGRAVMATGPNYNGDSITAGVVNISVGSNKYADRLSALYGATTINNGANGRSLSNFSGQTTSLVWSDETGSTGYLVTALRTPGSINLIALGVNDSNNNVPVVQFATDYARVLGNLIAAGLRPESIVLVSPWYQPGGTQAVNDATSQAMGAVIKALAAQYGCCYVDALNDTRIRSLSSANWDALGVHGNDAVHGQMYLSIRDAIAASWSSTALSAL